MERLNKLLARAGLSSRRGADRLIEEGRVCVNGAVVDQLGTRVDPQRDAVKLDGKRVHASSGPGLYLLLNKPRGYVTTLSDPQGRPTVRDLLRSVSTRVFPVGRLDFHTEGLLLLTDDGELARDLMHPRKEVTKVYAVKVRGRPAVQALERLRRGVSIDGRRTRPAEVSLTRAAPNSWLRVTVTEGRKHQVRRMLQAVGHPVLKLRRTGYGGVVLGDLAPGSLRPLTEGELRRLRRAVRRPAGRTPPRRPARRN